MNRVLEQVERIMHETLQRELSDVWPYDLERDGAIFYMNGRNGTAFDWYVNERFPSFFVFYNDEENLGAAKAMLHTDGNLTVYVYGDKGHAEPMIERRALLSKTAIVSKKVREGRWKIGYRMRDEPTRDGDSGWYFCVGDETEEHVNDSANLELWTINSVLIYDPALTEFIVAPYGTAIVRVASDKFEPDEPGKPVFIEKK